MDDSEGINAEVPAAEPDVSLEMRERYVAYRRAQAEVSAWIELGGEEQSETLGQLRSLEAAALDDLVKMPAASIADLAVKLQVLKTLNSAHSSVASGDSLERLAEDAARLTTPTSKLEGQIAALRAGLMLLLNAAAGDPKSLARAHQATLDLMDSPGGSRANSRLDDTAKEEVRSLFTWID